MYESKFVKQIIENFNHVLTLIEQQEQELKVFMASQNLEADSDSNDSADGNGPKVFKARLNKTKDDIKRLFTKKQKEHMSIDKV